MKTTSLIVLCSLFYINLFSQKEANVWYFGIKAGLDFSSGTAVPISNGNFLSSEASASICDKTTGQLLFYSDAEKVWDKNHNVLPNGNGLEGKQTAAQGCIFIPNPANLQQYYLFVLDAWQGQVPTGFRPFNNGGLTYSLIDQNLNSGNGDIVSGRKNIQLITPATEHLSAVKHCNGKDYWVVAKEYDSNRFHCYLVNSSGVQSAVISSVGTRTNIGELQGNLKFSPDGNKLAFTMSGGNNNFTELFDFDKSTGVISNPVTVTRRWENPYGVEFSPNSKLLYVSSNPYGVYQFQITCTGVTGKTRLGPKLGGTWGFVEKRPTKALQLGPDGRIYVMRTVWGVDSMDVILNPNNIGTSCNYSENYLKLPNSISTDAGGPNFIQSFFNDSPYEKEHFLGNDTTIYEGCYSLNGGLISPCSTEGYLWSTGETTQSITINKSGKYWMRKGSCNANSDTVNITIIPKIKSSASSPITATPSNTINSGESVTLSVIGLGNKFKWHPTNLVECDSCSTTKAMPKATTTFSLISYDEAGCSYMDTITIFVEDYSTDCATANEIFLPNTFTPNNDGLNDSFDYHSNTKEAIEFCIFNRWGELIYQKSGHDFSWDGIYQGKLVPPGIYVYVLTYNCDQSPNGKIKIAGKIQALY